MNQDPFFTPKKWIWIIENNLLFNLWLYPYNLIKTWKIYFLPYNLKRIRKMWDISKTHVAISREIFRKNGSRKNCEILTNICGKSAVYPQYLNNCSASQRLCKAFLSRYEIFIFRVIQIAVKNVFHYFRRVFPIPYCNYACNALFISSDFD